MKKSIFALMTMLSLGAAGLESGQAHAEEVSTSLLNNINTNIIKVIHLI